MANQRDHNFVTRAEPLLRSSVLLAGLAIAAAGGCGTSRTSEAHPAPTAGTGAAATDPNAATTAANLEPGAHGASGRPTSHTDGLAMSASAGTSAWINPQARQEPGLETATSTFNLQQVTFAQEGADFDPAISRDGSRVVFASTQHRTTADLYVKTVSGRTITQLTNDPAEDGTPDISPDGTKVAFASNRNGNWDIFVLPITGGKAIQITADDSDELHPSWSPDGSQLVFSRMGPTSGRWEMWVTEADKSGNGTFIGYGLFPRWCPAPGTGADGADRIVFQLGRERGQRSFAVWTVDYRDSQASNPTQIASSPTAALINPAWSPDGMHIVYASVPGADAWVNSAGRPPAAELWLASVNADASVQLTGADLRAIRPAWGPQDRLYFVSDRNSTENVWSIDMAQSLASIGATDGMTASSTQGRTQSRTSPVRTASAPVGSTKPTGKAASATRPRHDPSEGPASPGVEEPATTTAGAGDDDQGN